MHLNQKLKSYGKTKNLVNEYEDLKEDLDSIIEDYEKFEEKYDKIRNSISQGQGSNKIKKEEEKIEKLLYGFPDFAFYLKIASDKINLNKKVVKFKPIISQSSRYNEIRPFTRESDVPSWWTHYNKLKHSKINDYNNCTFKDLIFSMSGLFILMNYLLK